MELRVFYSMSDILSQLWMEDIRILCLWNIEEALSRSRKSSVFFDTFAAQEEYSNISKETKVLFLYTSYCEMFRTHAKTQIQKKEYIDTIYNNNSIDTKIPTSIKKDYESLFSDYASYDDFISRNRDLYEKNFSWDFIDMKVIYLIYNSIITNGKDLQSFLIESYDEIDMDSFYTITTKYRMCKKKIKLKK